MTRPTPDQFATESAFLDAVAKYVKQVTADNRAYGKKIDAASDSLRSHKCLVRKHDVKRSVKDSMTFHDMLNANPVLKAMHKQGRLF